MYPKLKNFPLSDLQLSEFLLSCFKLNIACKKLVKEIDDMTLIKCIQCKNFLTEEELQEGRENGLKIDEISCDRCWREWIRDKREEEKHPDEK